MTQGNPPGVQSGGMHAERDLSFRSRPVCYFFPAGVGTVVLLDDPEPVVSSLALHDSVLVPFMAALHCSMVS